MKPDQAISKMAFEAVDLLEQYRAQGGTGEPEQMVNCLGAAAKALGMLSGLYQQEARQPGTIKALPENQVAFVLREAHAAASGVLLVCSLMPGVDSLSEPVAH